MNSNISAEQYISYSRQQEIEIDVNRLSEEVKQLEETRNFQNKIKGIETTKGASLKQIHNFVGKKTVREFISTNPIVLNCLLGIVVTFFITLIITSVEALVSHTILSLICFFQRCLALLLPSLALTAIITDGVIEEYNLFEKVKQKTMNTHYYISDTIIDCPITIKSLLFTKLEEGYLYFQVNEYSIEFHYIDGDNKLVSTKWATSCQPTQDFLYFRNQCLFDKIYRISDMILDKTVKENII